MEYLARYIIRASFSHERMTYIPQESKVIYQSKDGKERKVFDALEWLAAMGSHVPDKGEQMLRYYGHYSNVSRGKRKKEDCDELIPSILEPDGSSKEYRRNWARLIQKIYEVDPLDLSQISGKDAYHCFHRGRGSHQENPQAPGIMGNQAKAAAKVNRAPRIQHRLLCISTPRGR